MNKLIGLKTIEKELVLSLLINDWHLTMLDKRWGILKGPNNQYLIFHLTKKNMLSHELRISIDKEMIYKLRLELIMEKLPLLKRFYL